MSTQEFVCRCLGLTPAESEYVDKICDNFECVDFDDSTMRDFLDVQSQLYEVDRNSPIKGAALCNFLIGTAYEQIVEHYTKEGLKEDLFELSVNSVGSDLYYNGAMVTNDADLEEILSNTYKVYAGYYELFVTKQSMDDPYSIQEAFTDLADAIEYCEKAEVTVHYDKEIRKEVEEYFFGSTVLEVGENDEMFFDKDEL